MAQYQTFEREASGIRSFTQLIRPWSGHFVLIILLVMGLALGDMVLPWALSLLVDDVFPALSAKEGGWELLWVILISLCVIYVLRNVLFFISRMISVHVSEQVCFDLRQRLFNHMQQLGMSFYKSNRPGQVSSRVMDDTFRIQTFIQDKLPTLLRYILEFQILLILLYVVNWKLALASTIVLPLHLWTYKKFYLPIRDSHHRAQKHLAEAHGNLIETFLGAQVVKGFSAESRETESFLQTIRAGRDDQIKTQRFQFAQKVVADLLVGAGTVLLLGYGAWEVYAGSMTIGAFLMFFWYVRMLYPAVLEIISGTGHFSRTSASVDRVLEMLDEPVDEISYDMRTRTQTLQLVGPIEFHDVSFSFDEEERILKKVNMQIDAGEHIVITGASGCGKSTMISLLPRFNDPTSGMISIGGHDIKDIRLQDVRDMFGVAFQDAFLFNASIYDNLKYARPNATTQEIVHACKLTGAHAFIEKLPDRYDTRIGERGGELSHGQKQRINLARALVRQPQTLIIDETTASIEADAAKQIMKDVLEHMAGRTVIIVTHDPAIMQLVHRVLTLENKMITCKDNGTNHMKHPTTKKTNLGLLTGTILCLSSLLGGCSRTTTTGMVEMENPTSTGIIIDAEEPVDLDALAKAIDKATSRTIGQVTFAAEPEPVSQPKEITPEEIADLVTETVATSPSDLFIQLDAMNPTEIGELIELVASRFSTEHGYKSSAEMLEGVLSIPPEGVVEIHSIAHKSSGITKIIRFGFKIYLSQPPQLWTQGLLIENGAISANEDVVLVEAFTKESIATLLATRANLDIRDLGKELVQLSYIDAPAAIELLNGFGITTFNMPSELPDQVDWAKLPYVALVPDPETSHTGLVGGAVAGGAFGLTMVPNTASQLSANMVASPTTQLIVFYDDAQPEQFSDVIELLSEHIDKPARQIFIEGMVLEINEDGLRDIGIDWNLTDTPNLVTVDAGKPNAGTDNDSLALSILNMDISRAFANPNDWILDVNLRALLRDGKAEILSRPSVLTLNNRQSTIRVGQDIPIATSTAGISNADMLSFNFKYLPTGIMLNVRPRISKDGSEVSMLIDTIVSSTVPGADLEIRDSSDKLLASAPTISSRRVQTYGRIPNDTPFIIGGLVNKEHHTILDKVPLLSDIPLVGGLFQSERTTSTKTEVIIVLTPHVLPENDRILSAMPKDDPRFDNVGNELFRDSYRIKRDDVFDLTFLEKNEQLQLYRELAQKAIKENFRLKTDPAFAQFENGHFPGESILVSRMVYEITKRLDLEDAIPSSRIAIFGEERNGGMGVEFLDQILSNAAGSRDARKFFTNTKDKAIVISFAKGKAVPSVQTAVCGDRAAWKNLLWTLNQVTPAGNVRHTIVLRDEKDLLRLRRAVALKHLVELNNGSESLTLDQFRVGQYLMIPDIDPKQVHIIDEDVARYFYQTEHYYGATVQAIEQGLDQLEEAIDDPIIESSIQE
ncbi:MAG: ATP-binding cassette domain-containing protein [Planctomycetes bacterium]|nr:ATP-binding cassette domain-containing protein [Planctomycetota bacterium]